MGDVTVGLVVNGASGHDIRRLISAATVVDNSDKGAMTVRLLAGLRAAGVDRVLVMPTDLMIVSTMRRLMRQVSLEHGDQFPRLEWLDFEPQLTASDTHRALELMVSARVAAVCVLGGDGTQRLAAEVLGDLPLVAVSTGTNNVFPQWAEPTTIGIATGLVATGVVPVEVGCVREHMMVLQCGGRREVALVDVGVSRRPWVGARALWDVEDLTQVAVVFTDPAAIGLSAIAAAVAEAPRGEPGGVLVRLAGLQEAERVVHVPMVPGIVKPVGIADVSTIPFGEAVELDAVAGTLAVDGEREVPRTAGATATVTIGAGPLRVDVPRTLAWAARSRSDATPVQRPGR